MKRATVSGYPWRHHLIKENKTETIATQVAGHSRNLCFLIFRISVTSTITQAEQNQIPLYSDPRASFAKVFGCGFFFGGFFGSDRLEHIFLWENCKYLTCLCTLMLQKALRTTRVQSSYNKAGTSSWHETEQLKEKGIFKHGVKLQIYSLFSTSY